MASEKTYNNVTQAIWDCVKTTSAKENGTTYTGADQGTATTSTIVGQVVLSNLFTPSARTLWYRIDKKPFVVSDSQIWSGVEQTLQACGGTA